MVYNPLKKMQELHNVLNEKYEPLSMDYWHGCNRSSNASWLYSPPRAHAVPCFPALHHLRPKIVPQEGALDDEVDLEIHLLQLSMVRSVEAEVWLEQCCTLPENKFSGVESVLKQNIFHLPENPRFSTSARPTYRLLTRRPQPCDRTSNPNLLVWKLAKKLLN